MEHANLYEDNAVTINDIRLLLEKSKKHVLKSKNFSYHDKLSDIEIVLDSVAISLKTADPILINSSHKSAVTSNLSQISSFLQNFVNNPDDNISHIDSAYSQAEAIKNELPFLISKVDETGIENIREIVSATRQSASVNLKNLSTEFEERIDEITKQVEELKRLSTDTNTTIENQKDRLDTAIAEFQKQFSERIGEFQKQFSEAEEDRRKKLEASIQNREKAYKKETSERTNDLNTWREQFTTVFNTEKETFNFTSNELIEKIKNHAQEAKVTVGLISEKSLQNDFIIQADNEKNRAWWWNLATFIEVGLLILAVGYIFIHTIIVPLPIEQSNYPQILSKFLVTAVIGIIARWTSRQANRHLAEERRLRKLALELATINPFLNNLPDEIQYKVKEILAMRYYGNSSDEKAPFGEMTPIHDVEGGFKSIPESILDNIRPKK